MGTRHDIPCAVCMAASSLLDFMVINCGIKMYDQLVAQGYGACLTKANLDDIKRFLEEFAVRSLLPAMEARVRALNHQASPFQLFDVPSSTTGGLIYASLGQGLVRCLKS